MNFVEELKWRGMINDIMPGAEEQLNKEMTSGYVGIDPTADSLHIGHLVGIMMVAGAQAHRRGDPASQPGVHPSAAGQVPGL